MPGIMAQLEMHEESVMGTGAGREEMLFAHGGNTFYSWTAFPWH